jgi:hypothetical protein
MQHDLMGLNLIYIDWLGIFNETFVNIAGSATCRFNFLSTNDLRENLGDHAIFAHIMISSRTF